MTPMMHPIVITNRIDSEAVHLLMITPAKMPHTAPRNEGIVLYANETHSILLVTICADPSMTIVSPAKNAALQILPDFNIFEYVFSYA